jgi:hypothetical protein
LTISVAGRKVIVHGHQPNIAVSIDGMKAPGDIGRRRPSMIVCIIPYALAVRSANAAMFNPADLGFEEKSQKSNDKA